MGEKGRLKIINDPFGLVIRAVEELYPETEAIIQFNPELRGPEYGECGRTWFPDDTSDFDIPFVEISTNIPFEAMVETLAHELAHVVAGIKAGHGEEWDAVFAAIQQRYLELQEEEMGEYKDEEGAEG